MSIKSEILRIFFTKANYKDKMAKIFYDRPRNTNEISKEKFASKFMVDEFEVDGFKVVSIKKNTSLNKHIIMLHGGAYILEAIEDHRKLIEKYVEDYNLKVTFIDYPLAPEHTCDKTVEVTLKAYNEITQRNKDDEFYLFGDSAGGGLAVVLLQMLRDRNLKPFPKKSMLASPWVDISMTNPKIQDFYKIEPMLQLKAVKYAAKLYAGERDLKDPLVSPLYGSLNDLGNMLIAVGTHEILNPDIMRFKDKIDQCSGTAASLILGNKMWHDWILLDVKEGRDLFKKSAEYYSEDDLSEEYKPAVSFR